MEEYDETPSGLIPFLGGSLVFFGAVEFLTIALSLFHLPIRGGVASGIFLVSALAGGGYGRFLGRLRIQEEEKKETTGSGRGWLAYPVFILAGILYLLFWAVAYLLPDFSWDGLWYHNPAMHFWALKGHVYWITIDFSAYWTPIVNSVWNGYPKAVELFGFVLIRATGLTRLLNAINLPWLPLGVLSVICLSRVAGAGRRFAYMCGLLFIFIPLVISQAPTTYVDAATASSFIAFLAMTALVFSRTGSGLIPWKLLPALGCSAGLALGVKGTGAILFLIVLLALTLRIIMAGIAPRSGGIFTACTATVKPGGSMCVHIGRGVYLKRGVLFLVLFVATALLVGGYWYMRNYLRTGSPFHPVGLSIGGHRVFPGIVEPGSLITPPYAPGTENWPQLYRLAFTWLQGADGETWKMAVTGLTSRAGGLGFLWLLGCLPSIVYLLLISPVIRRVRKVHSDPAVKILLPLLLIILILFIVIPHNHIARFTIWIYGIGLPCFAVAATRAWKNGLELKGVIGRTWVSLCVLVAVLEGLYAFCNQYGFRLDEYRSAGGEFSLSRVVQGFAKRYPIGYVWPRLAGSAFEEIVISGEPVALSEVIEGTGKNRILGHLTQYRNFGERRIHFLDRETMARDPARIRDVIERQGIRYIVWDTDIPIPRGMARLVDKWNRVDGYFYLLEVYPNDRTE